MVITAADLTGVKPIRRCCTSSTTGRSASRSSPTASCALSARPIAAVVAASEEEAEDIADLVELEIERRHAGGRCARGARKRRAASPRRGARQCHPRRQGEDHGFRRGLAARHKIVAVETRSRRQNATPIEARAAPRRLRRRTGRVTLTCTDADAASHAHRHRRLLGMPESDLRVIAPDVGGGFGQKMSLCAEYVVLVWLARKLKRSVAWTEDRRENLIASFHSRDQYIALEGAFDAAGTPARARGRHHLQCRRLFLLPDHLRRRAADGDGRDAGPLRCAQYQCLRARRRSPTPARWRPIAACRARSSRFRWNG